MAIHNIQTFRTSKFFCVLEEHVSEEDSFINEKFLVLAYVQYTTSFSSSLVLVHFTICPMAA